MNAHDQRHPQQALSAFWVILFHSFITGFIIQTILPFYWFEDITTKQNLLLFAASSGFFSLLLASFSSFKIYKTGSLEAKFSILLAFYSSVFVVLGATALAILLNGLSYLSVREFLHAITLNLLFVIIMALVSGNIWDKWRKTRKYD